jgi:ABC-type taurine transport system ATPase subunit
MATEIKQVPVHKSENGVWMLEGQGFNSAARTIAVEAMRALKHDTNDFRKRDAVIDAIYETLEGMLNYVAENGSRDSG